MMKKLIALLMAMALMLSLLTGCGQTESTSPEEEAAEETVSEETPAEETETEAVPEVPAEAREDVVSYLSGGTLKTGDVVMTVNGQDVLAEELFYFLSYQYTYTNYSYSTYGVALDLSEVVEGEMTIADALMEQAKNAAAANTLLGMKAAEAGTQMTEENLTAQAELSQNYDENTLLFYGTTLAALEKTFEAGCLGTNLKDSLFLEGGELAPTEEDLAAYAEEQGTLTCRYILRNTAELEETDEEGRAAELEKAQALYDQLLQVPAEELEAKFAELQATENFDGNTEPFTFDNSSSLVSGFREVVAELEVGELGLTEETDYGYFVLLRLPTDTTGLIESYSNEMFDVQLTAWEDEADVQYTEALEALTAADYFDRLIVLQDGLAAELAAQAEAEAAAAEDTEAAG